MRVVVTGGSRGIGKAIAESALKAGFSVHLVARDRAGVVAAAGQLSRFGAVSFSTLNLADTVGVSEFCESWTQDIHGLVNNAGYWREDPIDELDPHILTDMLLVNVVAPYTMTKGLLKNISAGGRVINIASQLGTAGRARMGAYCATKHALIGLTRCWAPEVHERSITVNAVCPGWINTDSNRSELQKRALQNGSTLESEMRALAAGTALERFIEAAEVAELVTFLLSSGASGITGQAYEIK